MSKDLIKEQVNRVNCIGVNSSIDIFKFFAAFIVVAIHTQPTYGTGINYYLNCFAVSAVPFFFCISSYLFFSKQSNITKYLHRIMLLYVVWFIIELPLVYMRFSVYSIPPPQCIAHFIHSLVLQNTFYASWYLIASCESMLLVYILFKYLPERLGYVMTIAIYLIGLSASMYGGFIPDGIYKNLLIFMRADQSFIVAIPFVTIGKLIAVSPNERNCRYYFTSILFISLIMVLESYICRNHSTGQTISLCMPIFIALLVRWSLSLNIRLKTSLSIYLRKSSILIYLIHPLIILALEHFCSLTQGALLFACTLSFTVLLSFLIVYLSEHFKYLKLLY